MFQRISNRKERACGSLSVDGAVLNVYKVDENGEPISCVKKES